MIRIDVIVLIGLQKWSGFEMIMWIRNLSARLVLLVLNRKLLLFLLFVFCLCVCNCDFSDCFVMCVCERDCDLVDVWMWSLAVKIVYVYMQLLICIAYVLLTVKFVNFSEGMIV